MFEQHRRSCDLSGSILDSEDFNEDGSCGSLNSTSAPQKVLNSSRLSVDEHLMRRSSVGSGFDNTVPPIWCIDCRENIVVLGCANGRLEFWEGASGRFKVSCFSFQCILLLIDSSC